MSFFNFEMMIWNVRLFLITAITAALLFSGCGADGGDTNPELESAVEFPKRFPPPAIPADNIPTEERIALGKRLFFDAMLSKDNSVSCASCHIQESAFSDPLRFSVGVGGKRTGRNSMPLMNVAWHPNFFWDGRAATLEDQAMDPVEHPNEMDNTIQEVVRRLKEHPEYPALFQDAYGTDPDPISIAKAIASFERSMISANSPFDRYSNGETFAMTASQQRGLAIFNRETVGCAKCHTGPLQTDFLFHNIGLYEQYPDEGRAGVTNDPKDHGRFKTPSLRNVAVTAPYMHDASMETLEEVVDHYAKGGVHGAQTSDLMQPFDLTEQEKKDLINFMHALTDASFLTNPEFAID